MRDDDETTPRLIEAPTQAAQGDASHQGQPDMAAASLVALATLAAGSADTPRDTDDDIRLRAFEIYRSRADADGDAFTDWLTAEREIRVARALGGNVDGNEPKS